MKISYYAILQYDNDGICVSFPDFPPCLTCADDDSGAMKMAAEALELYLHGLCISDLPLVTPKNAIMLSGHQKAVKIAVELENKNGRLYSPYVIDCR